MQFQMKAVVFDILAECRELKCELQKTGVPVLAPFLGIRITEALKQETESAGLSAETCLFITNKEQHAKEARALGMAVIGCVEGHFEVPKTTILLESPEDTSVSYLDRAFCHEKKLPAMIFETPRMVVKELTGEDMDALYAILTEDEVSRYLPAKAGNREEELEKLISYISCVYSFFEYGYWGVFAKESGALIGRAGFREGSYPPEVGYVIEHSRWGMGLGTEVLEHLIRYAGEEIGCSEIHAKIDKANTASIRVAQKCGFANRGTVQETGENDILLFQYDM